jgi:hypothetical protein
MFLNVIKIVDRISLEKSVYFLFSLIVILSSVKNITTWSLYNTHNSNFYHFPVLDFLTKLPVWFDIGILTISVFSLYFLLFQKTRMSAIPFVINGMANIYFMLADYLQLHHDMLLSGMVFVIYGLILYYRQSEQYRKLWNLILTAVVASTYLLSGIAKINGDFLSGEITREIIERADSYFYWPLFNQISEFSTELSWFSMVVEIIEPIFLILTVGVIKVYLILLTFPFHLGILLTGTGTVYNLIYPASFLYIVYNQNLQFFSHNDFIQRIYKVVAIIFSIFSLLYVVKITLRFLLTSINIFI